MPPQFQCRRIQPSAAARRLAVHRRKLSNLSRSAEVARNGARSSPLGRLGSAASQSFPKAQSYATTGRTLQVQPDLRTLYAVEESAESLWDRRQATSASQRSRGKWKDLNLEELPENEPDDDPPCDI